MAEVCALPVLLVCNMNHKIYSYQKLFSDYVVVYVF